MAGTSVGSTTACEGGLATTEPAIELATIAATSDPLVPTTTRTLMEQEGTSTGTGNDESVDSAELTGAKALWCLTAQHFSSSWGSRSFEFAAYLYLIILFPDTILPASLMGFFTTGAAIVLSGSVGQLVDVYPRLRFVRLCIIAQKGTVAVAYAVYLVFFLRLRNPDQDHAARWTLFALVTLLSAVLNLATIAISVSVERDWVTCIAQSDSATLTKLNAWLRRVDLLCKLLSPLFVSLLTTAISYTFSVAFLLGLSLVTMLFEFYWINNVYRRLPILAVATSNRSALTSSSPPLQQRPRTRLQTLGTRARQIGPYSRQLINDWGDFIRSPIFPSSLAISLLYMTVLSFDGTMLAYLKSQHYSDPFVAGMRGVGVVTGLMGTLMMPVLEKRIGVVRTGSWSIISEVITLVPVIVSFFVGGGEEQRGNAGKSAMLFTGMALSRIGLWSFDLCQLKELQTTLDNHPRKNSLMALQFSLQNQLDLIKYTLTIILSRPNQFKWAALASFTSVCLGALSYLWYARKERGHLVHLEWTEALLRKKTR